MIQIQRPIVRVLNDIVTAVSDDVLEQIQAAELAMRQVTQPGATESNIECITYMFGHFKEIVTTMKEWEASPEQAKKKYPLIALFLDFPEQKGRNGGYVGEVTLQMIVAYYTEPTLKAEERYTKTFEPILLPIYESLLRNIADSGAFAVQDASTIEHTKTDRPYWGKEGFKDSSNTVFADVIDAVELSNLRLTTTFNNC